jgi:hypothetical protein
MDIQPTPMGAVVDFTDVAVDTVLEMLAEALHRSPIRVERLMYALRDAAETRSKWLEREAAGRAVSPEMIAQVSQDVDAARDALKGLLTGRVLVSLAATDCLRQGAELTGAGMAAQERWRTPGQPLQLPGQRNGRAA